MYEFVAFFFGAFIAMIVDIVWFKIDYKKIEKGVEFMEHYHFGCIFIIIGVLTQSINPIISYFMFGLGLIFVIAEWRQVVEIANGKVIAGHPFAYGSSHFVRSTIVGITLLFWLFWTTVLLPIFI